MGTSWSHTSRRVFCCGPGAHASETSTTEPIYESMGPHQAHDAAGTLRSVMESVEEIRRLITPIADMPERMRRLELNLHPLLVYRPEDGEYMEMKNGPWPAPAAPPAPAPDPPARSVWLVWLHERVDYGEPW